MLTKDLALIQAGTKTTFRLNIGALLENRGIDSKDHPLVPQVLRAIEEARNAFCATHVIAHPVRITLGHKLKEPVTNGRQETETRMKDPTGQASAFIDPAKAMEARIIPFEEYHNRIIPSPESSPRGGLLRTRS